VRRSANCGVLIVLQAGEVPTVSCYKRNGLADSEWPFQLATFRMLETGLGRPHARRDFSRLSRSCLIAGARRSALSLELVASMQSWCHEESSSALVLHELPPQSELHSPSCAARRLPPHQHTCLTRTQQSTAVFSLAVLVCLPLAMTAVNACWKL
jgi:hypothetical protein